MRRLLLALTFLALSDSAEAASRFWVGGTGTWDASDTTHWAASTGGAGGQSVPGSSDTVTFDALSGVGTATVNTNIAITSLTFGTSVTSLDFSVNNNNITLSSFSGTGAGVRTLNLGNGTWTITGTGANAWNMATTTNLTFSANSSTIAFTSTSSAFKTFAGGSKTYNIVTVAAPASSSSAINITGSNTFSTLTVSSQFLEVTSGGTQTITTFSLTGSPTQPCGIHGVSLGSSGTISVASGSIVLQWATLIRDIAFSGGATFTATSSYDFGGNTGITITQPAFSGGIIGGS